MRGECSRDLLCGGRTLESGFCRVDAAGELIGASAGFEKITAVDDDGGGSGEVVRRSVFRCANGYVIHDDITQANGLERASRVRECCLRTWATVDGENLNLHALSVSLHKRVSPAK